MAESSQSVPTAERRRKRERKGKDSGVDAAIPQQPQAGSSKLPPLPLVDEARQARKREKRAKKAVLLEESKAYNSERKWDCVPIARSEVSRIPPVWSKDGRFYFTAANTSIHVHSSDSPFPLLSTLGASHQNRHKKPITALFLSPLNPFQLITASEDGFLKVWDWVEGRLVRSVQMVENGSVDHLSIGQVDGKWTAFASVSTNKYGKTIRKDSSLQHRIFRVSLSATDKPIPTLVGKLSNPPAALLLSPRSTYLVALAANKAYVYRLSSPSTQCVKFVSDQVLTCGAFSPERTLAGAPTEEEWFATGDAKGVIRLWHGLAQAFRQLDAASGGNDGKFAHADTDKKLPTTSLHWHAHAVAALAFTSSGAQLLSVGEESVLVQWHLASGKREYIPRLGGRPIISLAVRKGLRGVEEEWWLGLADGGVVKIGSASGSVSHVGQGIRLDPLRPSTESTPYPLVIHPSTQSLVVTSSHPSTLQFIDPLASSVVFDLEVAPSNRVSRRDEKILESVAVEKVAFSGDQDGQSKWMATMEGRSGDDVEGGGFVKNLKIWKWVGERYLVNTQFPRPHAASDISTITFSPLPKSTPSPSRGVALPTPYLLTTSIDGTAKIWQVRQAKKSDHVFWAMRSSFNYRNLPIYSAAFSSDATIIAMTHGPVVTLWDVESNVLLRVLDSGAIKNSQQLAFVGSEGRYLAVSGVSSGVAVWDLLSCDVSWSSSALPCDKLLPHPSLPLFLTIATTTSPSEPKTLVTTLSFFTPANPTPLRKVHLRNQIRDLVFLPTTIISPKHLHFAGVSSSGEVFRFGDDVSIESPKTKPVSKSAVASKTSIWQEMFGKDAFLEDIQPVESTTISSTALQQRITRGKPADVFDGPSHTMPPVGLLFDAFMDELLGTKASEAVEADTEEEMLYEQEEEKLEDRLPEVNTKSKAVDDDEIHELELFFKQVLSSKPAVLATPAKANGINGHKRLANGHGNGTHLPPTPPSAFLSLNGNGNGTANGNGHEDVEGDAFGSSNVTPVNKKIPNKAASSNKVLGTPFDSGSKVGRKRKATKDD
ncbi:NET1-associated nuclear protein 1 (U3 small nucleolar RNA-associated protein 17), partial [Tremellales sp. Uapishka_1]